MAELICPECDAEVPDTDGQGATGLGDRAGNVSWQPAVQRATCGGCGASLERNPQSDEAGLRVWRLDLHL